LRSAHALDAEIELFITNDDKIWKLRVPGIHFIVSIDTALALIV
jgi:hypothetical protein